MRAEDLAKEIRSAFSQAAEELRQRVRSELDQRTEALLQNEIQGILAEARFRHAAHNEEFEGLADNLLDLMLRIDRVADALPTPAVHRLKDSCDESMQVLGHLKSEPRLDVLEALEASVKNAAERVLLFEKGIDALIPRMKLTGQTHSDLAWVEGQLKTLLSGYSSLREKIGSVESLCSGIEQLLTKIQTEGKV